METNDQALDVIHNFLLGYDSIDTLYGLLYDLLHYITAE